MSGLPSLILSSNELGVLHKHYKLTLCHLQKLPRTTPDCVIFFLAGSLPIAALIHLRQLGLLGMIARLGENSVLQQLGMQTLLAGDNKRSWFRQVREICQQYGLPHPLLVLQSPLSKLCWKSLCKARIILWWEDRLSREAVLLTSLCFFRPSHVPL